MVLRHDHSPMLNFLVLRQPKLNDKKPITARNDLGTSEA